MVTAVPNTHQGKVLCLLCNGLITLVEEEDRFALHMRSLHDVFFNLEFLRAACHMDGEEKEAVIGVMNKKVEQAESSNNLLIEDTEPEESKEVINDEKVKAEECRYKMRKVTVDIPIYRPPAVPSPSASDTAQKYVRTKIFICSQCNKEFPAAFQSLASHKMKEHRMSKKDSQIITMKHVRYEDIPVSSMETAKPADKPSPSDLSDVFTDIFKPKPSQERPGEKRAECQVPGTKVTGVAPQIKQERQEALNGKEMEERLEQAMVGEAPQVKQEMVERESSRTCVLCDVKISSEEKLKVHMDERHSVGEERFHLLDDGGKSLFRVTDTKTPTTNTCSLCDEETANLGLLWNHYKKQHNISKDTIKSMMTKVRCEICFSQVTFIADHYRTFHKDRQPPGGVREERSQDQESLTSSSRAKLAKIWEKGRPKPAAPANNTKWSNIFDYKSSKADLASIDNIFVQGKQSSGRETVKKTPARTPDKNHKCSECGKQFQSVRILRNHLMFHRPNLNRRSVPKPKILKEEPSEEYHFCDYCDFSSLSESDFKKHVERDHAMEVDTENKTKKESATENVSSKSSSDILRRELLKKNSETRVTSEETGVSNDKEYVEKLIDKLKDIDDESEEEEDDDEDPLFSGLPRVLSNNLRSSEYFRLHRAELSVLQDERAGTSFTPDPPLGTGWRVCYFASSSGSVGREFLSPHNVRISSEEAVVQYIICSNTHTEQSIKSIKHYLAVK